MAAPMEAGRSDTACLKSYTKIPVHVVENHNEVLPHIYRAIGSRHLPLHGNQMLHFDSHPDMLIPQSLDAQDVFNKNKLFDELSIENWIIPSVYAGHFSTVIWLKPPWANQIKDSSSLIHVGQSKTDHRIRVTSTESYFLSELLYEAKDQLENAQALNFAVMTVGNLEKLNDQAGLDDKSSSATSTDVQCQQTLLHSDTMNGDKNVECQDGDQPPQMSDVSQIENTRSHCAADAQGGDRRKSADVGSSPPKLCRVDEGLMSKDSQNYLGCFQRDRPYVLDIDLDFFSTQNPFRGIYSPHQYELLQKLYFYTPPEDSADQGSIDKCLESRKQQLQELKRAFEVVRDGSSSTPSFADKERSEIFSALVKDLVSTSKETPVDWDWLHETGCTCDDTELPHHLSSEDEIKQLVKDVRLFLSKVPKPTLITISRSSEDDYCPYTQVDMIQEAVLALLHDLYSDLSIHKHYT